MGSSSLFSGLMKITTIFSLFSLSACSLSFFDSEDKKEITNNQLSPIEPLDSVESTELPLTREDYNYRQKCEEVISIKELYDFNSNFALIDLDDPPIADYLDLVQENEGFICVYENLSSKEQILLTLTPNLNSQKKSSITDSLSTTYDFMGPFLSDNDESYFKQNGQTGTLQIFYNNYWVSVSSSIFLMAEDTKDFISPLINKMSKD